MIRRVRTEDGVEQPWYFRGCAMDTKWECIDRTIGQLTEALRMAQDSIAIANPTLRLARKYHADDTRGSR